MKLHFVPQVGQIRDEGEFPVAYMDRLAHEQYPHLARQMAAGPEMLEALKECCEYLGDPSIPEYPSVQSSVVNALIRNVRTAIARAEDVPTFRP